MNNNRLAFTTGFALFSMFFGSGNLVFPIAVGQACGENFLWGTMGILLTGVAVPFLGFVCMRFFNGDHTRFFSCFGKRGVFLFSLLALSLLGPFGVLARCLTVVHGALSLLLPGLSLPIVSAYVCLAVYLLAINKGKILDLLGSALTPFLLLAIAAIAFFGIRHGLTAPQMAMENSMGAFEAFKEGFLQGYQTMDLLAAFFFSTFVIKQLNRLPEKESTPLFLKASLIGAGLLSLVYMAMVFLGAIYAQELASVPPQAMMGKIALEALGSMAAPLVCLAVVLACITTAIVLAVLFADFLRQEILKDKIGNHTSLAITLMIAFMVSTLDFAGIAKVIAPLMELIYPALIVLTFVNVAHRMWGFRTTH
jgi:LIVCS family branched-chain amino acid:cation transporter